MQFMEKLHIKRENGGVDTGQALFAYFLSYYKNVIRHYFALVSVKHAIYV